MSIRGLLQTILNNVSDVAKVNASCKVNRIIFTQKTKISRFLIYKKMARFVWFDLIDRTVGGAPRMSARNVLCLCTVFYELEIGMGEFCHFGKPFLVILR